MLDERDVNKTWVEIPSNPITMAFHKIITGLFPEFEFGTADY